jgi:hypothetical protein
MLDFWNVDHVWSSKILRNQGHKRIPASGSWHFARAMSCLDHCSTNNRFKVGHVHHVHWFMFSYDTWTVDIILWSTDLSTRLSGHPKAPRPQAHHLVSKTKEWPTPRGLAVVGIHGSCKNPEPFQMVFSHVIVFFPLIVFLSAGFTPSPKDSHERGKGKEKEE